MNSLEIIEVNEAEKLFLAAGRKDGVLIFRFFIGAIETVLDCYVINEGGSGDSYSTIEGAQIAVNNYRIAAQTEICNTILSLGTVLFIANMDETGNISNLVEIEVSSSAYEYVSSLEFSPDGNHLWFTKDAPPQIGVVDIANLTTSFPFTGELSAYAYSELETQLDENGILAIYAATQSGLKKITNPDNPALSSIQEVTWDNGIAVNTFPADGGGVPVLYTIQVQNTNAQNLQSFLASGDCCHDYSEFHFGGVPLITTANDGTWTDGNNPFDNQNSPIRITDDLTFPTGTVTTINNMVFEFDTDADVIIEKGAKVSLNGTV